MSDEEVARAITWIIYLLDLGIFLYKSDVCVANLDEPLDPGVIVEMMFSKMFGIPIIGYRTEMKTPLGSLSDPHGGLHFFCYYPCDVFIRIPNQSIPNGFIGGKIYDFLSTTINQAILDLPIQKAKPELGKEARKIVDLTTRLFEGVNNLKCESDMRILLSNYQRLKDEPLEPKLMIFPDLNLSDDLVAIKKQNEQAKDIKE